VQEIDINDLKELANQSKILWTEIDVYLILISPFENTLRFKQKLIIVVNPN